MSTDFDMNFLRWEHPPESAVVEVSAAKLAIFPLTFLWLLI